MNKRIKELAEQAGLYDEKTPEEVPLFTASFEKFAELLIRKCAMKANATALDLRNYPELDGRKYVGDCILKCFGVEE